MNRRPTWLSAPLWLITVPVLAQPNIHQQPPPRQAAALTTATSPTRNPMSPHEPTTAELAASVDASLTIETVRRQREEVSRWNDLTESQRGELWARWDQALRFLELASDFAAQSAQLQRDVQAAPDHLAQLEAELARPLPSSTPLVRPDDSLATITAALQRADDAWRSARDEMQHRSSQMDASARLAEIDRLRGKARDELITSANALQGLSLARDRQATAERGELQAKRIAVARRLELLHWEERSIAAFAEVATKQLQLARRMDQWCEQNVIGWRSILAQRSTPEPLASLPARSGTTSGSDSAGLTGAIQLPNYVRSPLDSLFSLNSGQRDADTLLVARQMISDVPPELREVAERNVDLSETRDRLAKDRMRAESDLRLVRDVVLELNADLADVTEKVRGGLTPAVGLLLRNRRDRLQDTRLDQQRVNHCDTEMQRAQTALLELRDERLGLSDLDAAVRTTARRHGLPAAQPADATLADATSVAGPADQSLFWSLKSLLSTRRDLLDALLVEFAAYHDTLSDVESQTREVLSRSRDYVAFIDKHVLWMRSEPPFGKQHATRASRGINAFNNVDEWSNVATQTMHNAVLVPGKTALLLSVIFVCFALRPGMKERLYKAGELAESLDRASFRPTFTAVTTTLGLSVLWPLSLWTVGWWMSLDPHASELTLAVGSGVRWMSLAFFNAEVIRHTCRRGGLASKHFGWNSATLREVYAALTWIMMLGLPLIVVVCVLQTYQAGLWRDSLGRASYACALAGVALAMQHLAHPRRGPLQIALSEGRFVWLHQFRHVWYALALGVPLALAALSLMGYTYTSQLLLHRVMYTSWLLLAVFLAYALLARAARVAVRQFERRSNAEGRSPLHEDDERCRRRALEQADAQIHQLLRGGVWLALLLGTWVIWSGVFPAADWLDRSGPAQATAYFLGGQAGAETGITWMDLGLIAFVALVTAIAVKTLPGILELGVLQRLPLDQGARYAVVSLSRYFMLMLGAIVIGRALGITWGSVQWLVAAMTVGLGFGLKDVFANVVSGFIVLLEHPVRLGDYVTVAGVEGRVTRIQVRATTITDQENRHLVVPNRKLVSDELVNWTLSDSVTRVVAPICVAHRTDPQIAEKVLLKLARQHPGVAERPQPSAVLVRIAEQGLQLELRAYVPRREDAEEVLNGLNMSIRQEFQRNGIELGGRAKSQRPKAA